MMSVDVGGMRSNLCTLSWWCVWFASWSIFFCVVTIIGRYLPQFHYGHPHSHSKSGLMRTFAFEIIWISNLVYYYCIWRSPLSPSHYYWYQKSKIWKYDASVSDDQGSINPICSTNPEYHGFSMSRPMTNTTNGIVVNRGYNKNNCHKSMPMLLASYCTSR